MTQGAAQSGAAPATLTELQGRLREAEKAEDTEQVWLLRRAITDLADSARVEEGGRRGG